MQRQFNGERRVFSMNVARTTRYSHWGKKKTLHTDLIPFIKINSKNDLYLNVNWETTFL
jgi:hypothetical protein